MTLEVTAQSCLPGEISDQQQNWFQIAENCALLRPRTNLKDVSRPAVRQTFYVVTAIIMNGPL